MFVGTMDDWFGFFVPGQGWREEMLHCRWFIDEFLAIIRDVFLLLNHNVAVMLCWAFKTRKTDIRSFHVLSCQCCNNKQTR